MVEVKAVGTFDPQGGSLSIEMALLPNNPLIHEMLAALLDESEKPEVTVDYTNVNDVVRAKLIFSTKRNIVKIGQAGLALRKQADDEATTIPEIVERMNAQTAKVVKAAKGEK
jgi:hypothetical protein